MLVAWKALLGFKVLQDSDLARRLQVPCRETGSNIAHVVSFPSLLDKGLQVAT